MKEERYNVVRAMELLARAINDENIFETWLLEGVADGDIDEDTTNEELEWYIEDDNFSELMEVFLYVMAKARRSGGLYFDGIVSKNAPH